MSLIITRKEDAVRIDLEILQQILEENNKGWSIVWYDKYLFTITEEKDIERFIQCFRDKENQKYTIIAYLESENTNYLQPFYIKGVGNLYIQLTEDFDPNVLPGSSLMKAGDYYEQSIANAFHALSKNEEDATPVQKWNHFIRTAFIYKQGINLILFTEDGDILYNNAEDGIFYDKEKLWFSEDVEENEDEPSEQLEAICAMLDDSEPLEYKCFEGLPSDEMLFLVKDYTYEMAELLKFGIANNNKSLIELVNIVCEECEVDLDIKDKNTYEIRNGDCVFFLCDICFRERETDRIFKVEKCCYQCGEETDSDITMHSNPGSSLDKIEYLCRKCYQANGGYLRPPADEDIKFD